MCHRPTAGASRALVLAITLLTLGCGDVARSGRSPAFIVIDTLEAAPGNTPGTFGAFLSSDVQTLVERSQGGASVRVPTVYADLGRATFRLLLRDQGTPANPTQPSTLNAVTLTRFRVNFRRADGRNTPGVDVPYGFDGAFTVTVPAAGTVTAGFDLVRTQMKQEPPLRNLVNGGGQSVISTIAEVTFWGQDQAGNEVQVMGSLTVNFGDFADPT